jgi:hypothetical protein
MRETFEFLAENAWDIVDIIEDIECDWEIDDIISLLLDVNEKGYEDAKLDIVGDILSTVECDCDDCWQE